jgi:hypothetical protein
MRRVPFLGIVVMGGLTLITSCTMTTASKSVGARLRGPPVDQADPLKLMIEARQTLSSLPGQAVRDSARRSSDTTIGGADLLHKLLVETTIEYARGLEQAATILAQCRPIDFDWQRDIQAKAGGWPGKSGLPTADLLSEVQRQNRKLLHECYQEAKVQFETHRQAAYHLYQTMLEQWLAIRSTIPRRQKRLAVLNRQLQTIESALQTVSFAVEGPYKEVDLAKPSTIDLELQQWVAVHVMKLGPFRSDTIRR